MYKSRLIYLALIIVSFIFSQSLYEQISFMTFIIILILPVVSILLSLLSYPFVKIKVLATKPEIYRFDDFTVQIQVKIYSPFISPVLKINCVMPDDEGINIEPVVFEVNSSAGNSGSFNYTRSFSNRGLYSVGVGFVEYYDFLKLIKIKRKINKFVTVKTNPRNILLRLPVNSQQQRQDNSTLVGTSITLTGGDMVGVREYVFGDNLKNVHWKLSAKEDDIIMKTFAEDIFDQAFVIADMSAYYEDINKSKSMTDCVVEATLSAIRDYAKNSIRFSLIINLGKKENFIYSIASPTDLFEAEKSLSAIEMAKDTSIIDLLKNIDFSIIAGAEICIISSFASNDTLKNIKKIFIESKNKINLIRISEIEMPEKDGVLTYSRKFIEKFGRCTAHESK